MLARPPAERRISRQHVAPGFIPCDGTGGPRWTGGARGPRCLNVGSRFDHATSAAARLTCVPEEIPTPGCSNLGHPPEAKGYELIVGAFGGGKAYNLYTFSQNFPPDSIRLFFTGDGALRTDLTRFEELGALKLLQPTASSNVGPYRATTREIRFANATNSMVRRPVALRVESFPSVQRTGPRRPENKRSYEVRT